MRKGFIDMETTGLPPKKVDGVRTEWRIHYEHFPRIVSIAWQLDDKPYNYVVINQQGIPIPPEATAIHGITDAMADESPFTFPIVASALISEMIFADIILGWNLYFDSSVLKANVLRSFGLSSQMAINAEVAFAKEKRFDMMNQTMGYFKAMMKREEAYKHCFGEYPQLAHNALGDMQSCQLMHPELVARRAYKRHDFYEVPSSSL